MKKHYPIYTQEKNGGIQRFFKFNNGYGASVIRHDSSYGSDKGLWELAVLSGGHRQGNFDTLFAEDLFKGYILDYSTPITNDVLGHLTEEQVQSTLTEISNLNLIGD